MWQNVETISSPNFSTSCPKSSHDCFRRKLCFQNGPKLHQKIRLLLKENWPPWIFKNSLIWSLLSPMPYLAMDVPEWSWDSLQWRGTLEPSWAQRDATCTWPSSSLHRPRTSRPVRSSARTCSRSCRSWASLRHTQLERPFAKVMVSSVTK